MFNAVTLANTAAHEKQVIQKSRKQPQSSVRIRKQKSCCQVIAIPRTDIATPTLTVMQGFQAKKRLLRTFPFPLLHIASILRVLPFAYHAFVTQARFITGCGGLKANAFTTRPRKSQ